jgi:hypothetical protein
MPSIAFQVAPALFAERRKSVDTECVLTVAFRRARHERGGIQHKVQAGR